jgi:hypothetical protein
MTGAGLYTALRPDKGVQFSYRLQRWWVRVMSFGKLEAPPASLQRPDGKTVDGCRRHRAHRRRRGAPRGHGPLAIE